MGAGYCGGLYVAQYSLGGVTPAAVPAVADFIVLIPADDLVVLIPSGSGTVQV